MRSSDGWRRMPSEVDPAIGHAVGLVVDRADQARARCSRPTAMPNPTQASAHDRAVVDDGRDDERDRADDDPLHLRLELRAGGARRASRSRGSEGRSRTARATVRINGQSTAARNRRQRDTPTVARGSWSPTPLRLVLPALALLLQHCARRDPHRHVIELASRGSFFGRSAAAACLGIVLLLAEVVPSRMRSRDRPRDRAAGAAVLDEHDDRELGIIGRRPAREPRVRRVRVPAARGPCRSRRPCGAS